QEDNCDHEINDDEINEKTEGSASSDLHSVNDIADMLKQATLMKNASSNYEEDIDLINDESPEWSECDDCFGSKKEYCEFCGCSVCKRKDDPGCILLCDGCEKGFHTRCLNPQLDSIPAGEWYCDECNINSDYVDNQI
ncbi:18359_t:CDS:2, partial [Racocetra fulgida]